MKAPARYHQVLSDNRWQAAFGRQSTVEQVMAYVISHWQELQANPPADMQAKIQQITLACISAT